MNCNCLEDTAKELTKQVMKNPTMIPKGATGCKKAFAKNGVLSMELGVVLVIPFVAEWEGGKRRQSDINISASFCPFCGIKAN